MRKRKVLSGLVMSFAVMSMLPSVSALAAENVESGHVYVTEDVSPKTRATVSAGGGTWTYGIDGQWCISYYNHNSKRHRATAKNGNGSMDRTPWMPVAVYARARIIATPWGGNEAFWDTRTD